MDSKAAAQRRVRTAMDHLKPKDRSSALLNDEDHVARLRRYLDGDHFEMKDRMRKYLADNRLFDQRDNLSLAEERSLAHERAKTLLAHPEIARQLDTMAEMLPGTMMRGWAFGDIFAMTDISVNIKMGVMTWLFGGAIARLGSDLHIERWFSSLKNLEFTGMFCMTEKGHGSNVRCIETTAHFDAAAQEFIIHTPHDGARKLYIGNAMHGDFAVVFAQLIIDGESKGPHAFVVRTRQDGQLCEGVVAEDMGPKAGLNGVDNGSITFHQVRVPRDRLLNRFADVSPAGRYTSSIDSNTKRFNAMLAALTDTRVALSFTSTAAMKVGLAIAITYATRRRQFGPSGAPEMHIMDYQTHQLRLMPFLATSLALTFTTKYAGHLLEECTLSENEGDREVQALCAGLKAYSTWQNLHCLQTCRECCGGQGYMLVNKVARLRADSDIFVTFEGDNTVLLQQVAKDLLAQYSRQFEQGIFTGLLSFFNNELITAIRTSSLNLAFLSAPVTSSRYYARALAFREGKLLHTVALRLVNKVKRKRQNPFLAWNECLDHLLAVALTHVQRICVERFVAAVEACPDRGNARTLKVACDLYAMNLLYEERGWYLSQNYMNQQTAKELRKHMIGLAAKLAEHAPDVVDAFGIPESCLQAPIAGARKHDSPEWAYVSEGRGAADLNPEDLPL